MIPSDLSPVWNHLWQSTLIAGVIWLLTAGLRKNRAAVRYWLWLAASAKFLVPFSLLVNAGSQLEWRSAPVSRQPALASIVEQVSAPFVPSVATAVPATSPNSLPAALCAIWLCGVAIGAVFWVRCWRRVRDARRSATPLPLNLPIPAMSSTGRIEPGVFGIIWPVLLLPLGIGDRLTPAQLQAVIAHELCHVRRRDNLTGAIHMVVETLFWFHPLIWWLRARLVEERERACDEHVLAQADPHVYAEGILNVCKFYLESPLVCAAGVTGADLKKRIKAILAQPAIHPLSRARKVSLAVAGALGIATPVLIGIADAPAIRAQSDVQPRLEFEVSSVKENHSGRLGTDGFQLTHGSLVVENVTLKMLLEAAYDVQSSRIVGGPSWAGSDRYDIVAKGASGASRQQIWLMLRSLLADRFKVGVRYEVRELPVYSLEVAKNGPKLQKQADAACQNAPAPSDGPVQLRCGTVHRVWGPQGGIIMGEKVSISAVADAISAAIDRPVTDKTGLLGAYNVELRWTPDGFQTGPRAEGEERRAVEAAEPGPSIFSAVPEQLGLKLLATKGPVRILVIDHAEKPLSN